MIRNDEIVEEQQNETSFCETEPSPQNHVAISAANNGVVRVLESSSSDEWSSSDEEGGKQVAQISPQAPAENRVQVTNTYTDCKNVSSTVQNTNIYKEGVTVNNNFYCCPSSLDYVAKWYRARRRTIIITVSVLVTLLIIFLGIWLLHFKMSKPPNDVETETTSITPTTEKIPQSTTVVPPTSTNSISSTTVVSTSTDSSNSSTTENPHNHWIIIKRNDWGAEPPKSLPIKLPMLPPRYVIFSETETQTCVTAQKCMETVRNIQVAHIKSGLGDIANNFLIGGDGMVYEGRGWDVYANSKDYDTKIFYDWSISVSFVGKFDTDVPTEVTLQAAKTFLEFGSQNAKLVKKPRLKCLRQLSHTKKNPGDNLYKIIETWEGWDNITIHKSLSYNTTL